MTATLEAESATTEKAPKTSTKTASGKAAPSKVRRLILPPKDKSAGTSVFLRFLAELHQRRGTPGVRLVDGDGTTGSLSNHFGLPRENPDAPELANPANPVSTFALHGTREDRDSIANLLTADASLIILDLPSVTLTTLRKIQADYDLRSLIAEYNWRPTVLASIAPHKQSIFDLRDAIDVFGLDADYIAVVNVNMADERRHFKKWDSSQTRARILGGRGVTVKFDDGSEGTAVGGREIEFPKLDAGVFHEVTDEGVTFYEALRRGMFGLPDRQRLTGWLEKAEASLAPAADWLGL